MLPVCSQCAPSALPVCSSWQTSCSQCSSVSQQCIPSVLQHQPSKPGRLMEIPGMAGRSRHCHQGWCSHSVNKCQGFNCNGVNWCRFRRLRFNCSGFNATALSAEVLIATPPGSSEAQCLWSHSLCCSSSCSPFPAPSQQAAAPGMFLHPFQPG